MDGTFDESENERPSVRTCQRILELRDQNGKRVDTFEASFAQTVDADACLDDGGEGVDGH